MSYRYQRIRLDHNPHPAGPFFLGAFWGVVLTAMLCFLFGCSTTCPPVVPPETAEVPVAAPCTPLPAVEIPQREAGTWPLAQIKDFLGEFVSDLNEDYLRLYDAAVLAKHIIDSHNLSCEEVADDSDPNPRE